MRIAVPTNDMITISAHFGRSKGFVIIDVKNNNIVNKSYTVNTFTAHAKNQNKPHEHGEKHAHSHTGIFSALGTANIVIAKGMGQRLFNDFYDKDMKVYLTKENSIDNAVKLLIQGKLKANKEICCQH